MVNATTITANLPYFLGFHYVLVTTPAGTHCQGGGGRVHHHKVWIIRRILSSSISHDSSFQGTNVPTMLPQDLCLKPPSPGMSRLRFTDWRGSLTKPEGARRSRRRLTCGRIRRRYRHLRLRSRTLCTTGRAGVTACNRDDRVDVHTQHLVPGDGAEDVVFAFLEGHLQVDALAGLECRGVVLRCAGSAR